MPIRRDEFGRPADLPSGFQHWPTIKAALKPEEVVELYNRGFAGAFRDPEAVERLHDSFGRYQTFGDWAGIVPGLEGAGEGKLVMLYQYRMRLDPTAYQTAQRRGDCVSFAYANAIDAVRCTEILAESQYEAFVAASAPEWIYWGRGHSGEGASCARVGEFVTTGAGVLLRREYPELGFDLRKYNPAFGENGRVGPPEKAVAVAREHNVNVLTRITDIKQGRDAIASGHPLVCCSGLSWSNHRDERGVSKRTPQGWAHAMSWDGVDDRPETVKRYGGTLFKIAQSWGDWNSGGWAEEYGPCPTGGFWVLEKDAAAAIAAGGTYAVADFRGFRPTVLPTLGATGRL